MLATRRQIIAGAGAATALAALGASARPAWAKAPLAGAQVPGVQRRRVGEVEVTAILDGAIPLGLAPFLGVEPAELEAILAAAGLSPETPTAVNAFLLNSAERTILIDTGTGRIPNFGPGVGRLGANLAAAGVAPEQIDMIVLTHAHPDHDEGLVDEAGAAVFPNAELVMTATEHGFWHDEATRSRFPADFAWLVDSARRTVAPYAARTRLVDSGEIAPGLELLPAPGHTPGHAALWLTSGAASLLIVGDLIHNSAIHTARPATGFAYDTDPAEAAATRARFLDMVSSDRTPIAGTHIGFPGIGLVLREGEAYRFAPLPWDYAL